MRIIDFKPGHVDLFVPHGEMIELIGISTISHGKMLAASGPAFTGINDDRIIGCGGCAEIWPGRHMLWALLSEESGLHMLAISRMATRLMALQSGRIEAAVRADFKKGNRWVELLGLPFHHKEEKFFPGGLDANVYVRFQDE